MKDIVGKVVEHFNVIVQVKNFVEDSLVSHNKNV